MSYRFARTAEDYTYLASGSVLHSARGLPAFPVRLASEMFQRGLSALGATGPVTMWDPCCGSGYLVTVLAILHRADVHEVIASDIDSAAVGVARRNLALLTQAGLTARTATLAGLAEQFGKASYGRATEAAAHVAGRIARGGDVRSSVHVADAFDSRQLKAVLAGRIPQLVITDTPYGEQTDWQGPAAAAGTAGMVRAVASVVPASTVVVLAHRGRTVPLGGTIPLTEKFKIGTRSIAITSAANVLGGSVGDEGGNQ